MNREEIATFLASLKKLRDGLDDFNCQLAAIDGLGMRLGMLCQETATGLSCRCGGNRARAGCPPDMGLVNV